MIERTIVFTHLIKFNLSLILKSRKLNPNELSEMLEEIKLDLQKLNIDVETKRILFFLFSNKDIEPTDISLNILQYSFQKFYEKCCEYIGPVDTDKIVSMALQKAGETEEGLMFDPRNFLR